MKNQIVISRYNEDIEWIKYINTELFDIFIYNKGNKLTCNFNCKIINLKNSGRESHTYLYHIITNYENLPEKIVFTQAHPFDHTRESFINEINNFDENTDDFFYFSKNTLEIKYDEPKNKFVEYGILNNANWINYHDITSPLFITIEKLFGAFKNNELRICFGPGAIFGVNKNLITKRSKDFYMKCINILNNSDNLINPDEGHSFERLWHYILTDNFNR